jgi:DNA-binding response OmpR family regulator
LRAYDLLLHLVMDAGRVVPRDEPMRAVWGDAVVGDNNLHVQVCALRPRPGRQPLGLRSQAHTGRVFLRRRQRH